LWNGSTAHYYQPAWTLVGAGAFDFNDTKKEEKKLIPPGVEWIKDYATTFEPESNLVHTRNSGPIGYDALVISSGIQMDVDALPGLSEALKTDVVCSNYLDPEKTYRVLQNFKGGNAVFSQPVGAIRCGGAPKNLSAEEYLSSLVRENQRGVCNLAMIFGTKVFR
jgi:sulfide:quinone oxidoreductase